MPQSACKGCSVHKYLIEPYLRTHHNTFYLLSEGCFWSSMHGMCGCGNCSYNHILTLLLSPPTHKIHIQLFIFHSHMTRCQEEESKAQTERERPEYVWRDQLLRACAHLNTPLSHWTNEADGSTVACLENYTIITGFTNISPPHSAPSLSHHLSHFTQFPGLLWHVKCTAHLLVSSAVFKPCNTEYCTHSWHITVRSPKLQTVLL